MAAACVLVIEVYAYTSHPGYLVSSSLNAADAYYNLLAQGFRAGQLSLKKEVPPGLAQLANPYDRTANTPYGVLDLSYYKGKLYLYFGVTPVVVLFWPYVALTGHYLLQKDATVILCLVGFLVSAGLLCALWRRYFAEVNVVVVGAGILALGLATFIPFLLARCDVHEVSISCGYAFAMLALAAIWQALHQPERRGRWLAAASLAYGLAVGARPSLLLGAVVLLVPVAQAWRERRKVWAPLIAATGPIVLIGLGLMLYNALRFDDPFEFGLRYQLAGDPRNTRQSFGLHYLWFHFRIYFLEPAHWSSRFPFVHDITVPPLPVGHGNLEKPFGVLTNVPLVWLALALPLAWRGRSAEARSTLRGVLAAVTLFFGISALTVGAYFGACTRYEVEFLPALVLLAVVGILSLERALAGQPAWRHAARWGWGLLLGFSVAFNLLVSVERRAEAHASLAVALLDAGKTSEAIAHYEQALRLNPDYVEAHYNLGVALRGAGRVQEAVGHWEQALRINPDYAEAHNNLGNALFEAGKAPEAIAHYEQALRIKSDYAEAHNNLGAALTRLDRLEDAIGHYEQALRIKPDFADARNNLRTVSARLGKANEAIRHYVQALRTSPDDPEAHYNLGVALEGAGRMPEAVGHYEQALRIKPDYAEVHYNLGFALSQTGKLEEAIGHWEQAVRFKPDFAEAHYNLGSALAELGRAQEAIGHYEEAFRLKPDFAVAHNDLGIILSRTGKRQEAIKHWEQALRINPDLAEAHCYLGAALEEAGRVPEAIGHYEQAVRLNPGMADAQSGLARLRTVK